MNRIEITKTESDNQLDSQASSTHLLKCLKELGFTHTLVIESSNRLMCRESDEAFTPEQVTIKGLYRYEGVSDPEDMTIVYALELTNGTRGVIMDAFGPQSSPIVSEFMEHAHDCRQSSSLQDMLPTDKEIRIAHKEVSPDEVTISPSDKGSCIS